MSSQFADLFKHNKQDRWFQNNFVWKYMNPTGYTCIWECTFRRTVNKSMYYSSEAVRYFITDCYNSWRPIEIPLPGTWCDGSSHLISIVGRRGTTDDVATTVCLPLTSGNLQTPFMSTPGFYLPLCSSVFFSFLLLSLSTAETSSPCQRILRCGHTIWVRWITIIQMKLLQFSKDCIIQNLKCC